MFFFRHNFQKPPCKNIFLVSSHSHPSPLVHAPPQLTLFPSPNIFHLCPLLSASPSTAVPFAWKTISNDFNAISTSLMILAEKCVPVFDYRIRLISLEISFGVEKLKRIILSSSSVTYPSKKNRSRLNKDASSGRCLY